MNLKRILGAAVAVAALAASTGTAHAAPKGADVRSAVAAADASLALSIASANAGDLAAARAQIARTRALEARTVRVAHRVGARGGVKSAAKQIRRAGGAVDRGFSAYATLLPSAPPELREPLVGALSHLGGLRVELGSSLDDLVGALPAEIRGQVASAIIAFQNDGNLDALIAALKNPVTAAFIRAHLGDLVDQVVATLQDQINDPAILAGLTPGSVEGIRAVIVVIQSNREAVITALDKILTDGGMNLPSLSADMCSQVELVFGQLGIPVPAGLCR